MATRKISRLLVFESQPPVFFCCDYDTADGIVIDTDGDCFVIKDKEGNIMAEISIGLKHVCLYD